MKRLLVLWIILLAFSVPVLAQNSPVDPAAYLPDDFQLYVQIRTDEAGLASLNQVINLILQQAAIPDQPPVDFADQVSALFVSVDFRRDVLPWLGDHIGIGVSDLSQDARDAIFVLPITDPAGAQAFVAMISNGAAATTIGGVSVYKTETLGLAVGSKVMWLSTPSGIDALLASPMLERLSDNTGYQKVWAALPADAIIDGYLSGASVANALAQYGQATPTQPSVAALVEAAFRLHPAESAIEDALLAQPPINGIGFALQVADNRLDGTTLLSLDAIYPEPVLPTTSAGTALLNLVPADSFLVFDSYDISAAALPLAGLTLLGTTSAVFDDIVAGIGPNENPATPTPTPTPAPLITADMLIAQVQPILAQAESTMGLSLDDLYSLTNGEYAVSVFPGAGLSPGVALYLQSSDPQRLIDTLDHVSRLILTDPASGQQLITIEHTTVDGVDVALLGEQGAVERAAVGILNTNVLFVTLESSLSKVIAAASQTTPSPAAGWIDAFGSGQEALLYADPRTLNQYSLGIQRNPPLPATAIAGSLDLRDDGLFVLRFTATLGS